MELSGLSGVQWAGLLQVNREKATNSKGSGWHLMLLLSLTLIRFSESTISAFGLNKYDHDFVRAPIHCFQKFTVV